MTARMLEIEADPTLSGTGRMVLNFLESLRVGFAEAGAHLTADQETVLAELEVQVRSWSA